MGVTHDTAQADRRGSRHLALWPVGAAAALIARNGLLSFGFGLSLEKKLTVASARTLIQLIRLGWLHFSVFRCANGWLVGAIDCAWP